VDLVRKLACTMSSGRRKKAPDAGDTILSEEQLKEYRSYTAFARDEESSSRSRPEPSHETPAAMGKGLGAPGSGRTNKKVGKAQATGPNPGLGGGVNYHGGSVGNSGQPVRSGKGKGYHQPQAPGMAPVSPPNGWNNFSGTEPVPMHGWDSDVVPFTAAQNLQHQQQQQQHQPQPRQPGRAPAVAPQRPPSAPHGDHRPAHGRGASNNSNVGNGAGNGAGRGGGKGGGGANGGGHGERPRLVVESDDAGGDFSGGAGTVPPWQQELFDEMAAEQGHMMTMEEQQQLQYLQAMQVCTASCFACSLLRVYVASFRCYLVLQYRLYVVVPGVEGAHGGSRAAEGGAGGTAGTAPAGWMSCLSCFRLNISYFCSRVSFSFEIIHEFCFSLSRPLNLFSTLSLCSPLVFFPVAGGCDAGLSAANEAAASRTRRKSKGARPGQGETGQRSSCGGGGGYCFKGQKRRQGREQHCQPRQRRQRQEHRQERCWCWCCSCESQGQSGAQSASPCRLAGTISCKDHVYM